MALKAVRIVIRLFAYCELTGHFLSTLKLGITQGEEWHSSPLIKHEMTSLEQRPCFLFPDPWSKVSSSKGQCLIFPITSSSFLLPEKIESLMELLSSSFFFKHSWCRKTECNNVLLSKTNFLINYATKAHSLNSLKAETVKTDT